MDIEDEWKRLTAWFSAPFTTAIPLWQLMTTFAIFVVIAWAVWDNLDILKKGLQ